MSVNHGKIEGRQGEGSTVMLGRKHWAKPAQVKRPVLLTGTFLRQNTPAQTSRDSRLGCITLQRIGSRPIGPWSRSIRAFSHVTEPHLTRLRVGFRARPSAGAFSEPTLSLSRFVSHVHPPTLLLVCDGFCGEHTQLPSLSSRLGQPRDQAKGN